MADPSDARDVLLNRLADEFAARQRAGERPRVEEYCDRHPDLADDIQSLFPALVELERAKADAGPELAVDVAEAPPVTQLGDFRLLREVGRGGMGVVYEAEQDGDSDGPSGTSTGWPTCGRTTGYSPPAAAASSRPPAGRTKPTRPTLRHTASTRLPRCCPTGCGPPPRTTRRPAGRRRHCGT